MAGSADEVVQRDRVPLRDQPAHPGHHLVVDLDGLQYLQHRVLRPERQRQPAGQEVPGEVDEAGQAAGDVGQAELGEGVVDDRDGRRRVTAARLLGLRTGAEQQFVRDDLTGRVVDGLPPDVHEARLLAPTLAGCGVHVECDRRVPAAVEVFRPARGRPA